MKPTIKKSMTIGARLFLLRVFFFTLISTASALAQTLPYISIEGNVQQGQSLGATQDAQKAAFIYQQWSLPIEYKYVSSKSLKDANGNALAFPEWAKLIIQNDALVDWIAATNAVQGGTEVMNATLAAGEKGRFFAQTAEQKSFQTVYPFGVGFQNVAANAVANISFAFEDFGNAAINALLRDTLWPGKPLGPWQNWESRTAGLDKDANGAIIGAKDANGNPIGIAVDGTLGVWIPEQILLQNKTLFALPHDFAGDMILFNSKVNWNMTADAPMANQLDFYHVALHEVGHGLGFDHVVPEPATLLLLGVGLVLLARPHRRVA